MLNYPRFIAESAWRKAALWGAVILNQVLHGVFFLWPLLARVAPGFVEPLRFPLATALLAVLVLLDMPVLALTLYLRWRWRHEGTLALRLPAERKRHALTRAVIAIAFHSIAAYLLTQFTGAQVAASLRLQAFFVLVSVLYLISNALPILVIARRLQKS